MRINSIVRRMGQFTVPNPPYGDMRLNVMPFEHSLKRQKLPPCFEAWEGAFNKLLRFIPLRKGANQHYLTIDSKFFPMEETLRRPGIHLDGNFCVDPTFKNKTWGGTTGTWLNTAYDPVFTVVKDWELPYDIEFPVGDYVSDTKGGILCVASEVGCQAWQGHFEGDVGDGGDLATMSSQFTPDRRILLNANTLYFMTSNAPHETLPVAKGKRRTLLRITLNHEYPNELILKAG